MQLALIGYGKMGQSIYKAALTRGHQVVGKFNTKNALDSAILHDAVCIDFTSPKAFRANYQTIADNCRAMVIGTTGWEDIQQEVLAYFVRQKKTLIYASNFSIGANIYFEIIKTAAKLFAGFGEYDPYVIEMHHREKKDMPSGTAKTVVDILQPVFNKKINPVSVRSGWIRGIHEVGYESMVDKVVIKHEAYTRDGFAVGAVLAAEWTDNITGVWNFQDLLATKFREILKCDN
ncbi:4-hydroxy-tetrahydrodipicolinate reductase [Gammaproteobacteria bacterium]